MSSLTYSSSEYSGEHLDGTVLYPSRFMALEGTSAFYLCRTRHALLISLLAVSSPCCFAVMYKEQYLITCLNVEKCMWLIRISEIMRRQKILTKFKVSLDNISLSA